MMNTVSVLRNFGKKLWCVLEIFVVWSEKCKKSDGLGFVGMGCAAADWGVRLCD